MPFVPFTKGHSPAKKGTNPFADANKPEVKGVKAMDKKASHSKPHHGKITAAEAKKEALQNFLKKKGK